MAEAAERVLAERCGLVLEIESAVEEERGAAFALAYPLLIEEDLHGAVTMEVRATSEATLRLCMQELHWAIAWLEVMIHRRERQEEKEIIDRLGGAIELQSSVLSEERYEGACMAFVTGLARRLECDRASIGFMKRGHVRTQAISHSAQFGRHMKLNRSISHAMEELYWFSVNWNLRLRG